MKDMVLGIVPKKSLKHTGTDSQKILVPNTLTRIDNSKKKLPDIFYSHFLMLYFSIIKIMIMKQTTNSRTRKTATARRTQKTTYVSIGNNVYYDGHSYRVRISVDGNRISQNFSSKRKAITFRNTVLAA
jgi:hypothetical protein